MYIHTRIYIYIYIYICVCVITACRLPRGLRDFDVSLPPAARKFTNNNTNNNKHNNKINNSNINNNTVILIITIIMIIIIGSLNLRGRKMARKARLLIRVPGQSFNNPSRSLNHE